jgi:hypothetical protein
MTERSRASTRTRSCSRTFRAGRYAEAKAAYATILEHEPGHFICLHHLGLIAHARGEHAAAARLIEQALAIKPDYIEALSNLAAIHRRLGNTERQLPRRGRRSLWRRNSRKPIPISAMRSRTRATSTRRSPPTGRPPRSIPVSSRLIRFAPICCASSAGARKRPPSARGSSPTGPIWPNPISASAIP